VRKFIRLSKCSVCTGLRDRLHNAYKDLVATQAIHSEHSRHVKVIDLLRFFLCMTVAMLWTTGALRVTLEKHIENVATHVT
jgi:hypothetical protein